jgi:DNA-directed RNA polymerase specialized sigma24 family protein
MSKKTASPIISRPEVVALVNDTNATIERWETAIDAPQVQWRGMAVKAVSEAVADSLEALFAKLDTLEVALDAQSIVLTVDEFSDRYVEWAEMSELSPEMASPKGSPEMWAAWGDVLRSLPERPQRRLEPIAQLDIEKVSDRQIAMIYGWKLSDGSPDVNKVREERAKPGTHYNPEEWVDPQYAREDAETAARWTGRSIRVQSTTAGEAPMAPETLDDLIHQDVPSKQIARMLNITVDEVRTRARQLNVPLDGQFVPSVSPHDKMQDIRDADNEKRRQLQAAANAQVRAAETDVSSMPERILSLAADGQNPKQIAKLLADDFPGLNEAKVAGILAHAKASAVEV